MCHNLFRMDTQTIRGIKIDPAKLIEARKERGLSKAEVGRELGFDRRQIWQFEQGTALTLENFTKLMMFYRKPMEFFITVQKS